MGKLAALILFLIVGIVIGGSLYSRGMSIPFFPQPSASISGELDINGVVPSGATISLTQKEVPDGEAEVFADNLPALDRSKWSFNEAKRGNTYEIQAVVKLNGEVISHSSPLTVSAPADEEAITLNISSDSPGTAVISGGIVVNGYIPQGSTINIIAEEFGGTHFDIVVRGLQAQANQSFSYAQAQAGTQYQVQAIMLDSQGVNIGESNTLAVAAPAANETLSINSTAQAPASPTPTTTQASTPVPSTSAISGSIDFNGQAPANSRIVVFEQTTNSNGGTGYQVAVDNISPIDGTTWTWNGAEGSTWYTLVAVLKQRNSNGTDTDIATSAPVTIAAPATNVIFTINSGVSLAAPGGPISVNCQTYNSGPNQNNWSVQVSFQSVSGAQSYWYQIGSTNGGNNIVNTTSNAGTGSTQQIGATFNNNTTYYARYAYANIPNAGTSNPEYSGFSSTTPLQCGN